MKKFLLENTTSGSDATSSDHPWTELLRRKYLMQMTTKSMSTKRNLIMMSRFRLICRNCPDAPPAPLEK